MSRIANVLFDKDEEQHAWKESIEWNPLVPFVPEFKKVYTFECQVLKLLRSNFCKGEVTIQTCPRYLFSLLSKFIDFFRIF